MIVFCRPRYEYQSYWDLYQLITLSGFSLIYFDEIDWESDNVYIASPLNGEFPTLLPTRKCRVIWLNIERPYVGNPKKFDRPDFDDIWVCDRRWAEQVDAKHFIMGSHEALGLRNQPKSYDWISCTYENPRRTATWSKLKEYNRGPNGWPCTPEERATWLAASRLYVVPQQDPPPHAVTPLRFAIAAAFQLPMIYEGETDTYPFTSGVNYIHSEYTDIPRQVGIALQDPAKLKAIGNNLHQMLCVDSNFKQSVERMLE